jgi:hypothetical protein
MTFFALRSIPQPLMGASFYVSPEAEPVLLGKRYLKRYLKGY